MLRLAVKRDRLNRETGLGNKVRAQAGHAFT